MTAFTRELTDEEWYTARAAAMSTVLRNIDAKTVKAANGTAGSNHAPAAAVIIGGAGMTCAGEWRFAGAATTSASKHVTLGGLATDDYIRLAAGHPGESRTMDQGVLPVVPSGYLYLFTPSANNFSLVTRYPGVRNLIPLQPHNRSTLATLRLRFHMRCVTHARLPVLPKFRVIRVDKSGNVEALHTARSGSYRDEGFLDLVNPANVAAYEAAAAIQWSDTYTTDQNNVVDTSLYAYFVDFIEESGPDAFTPNVNLVNGAGTNIRRVEMVCNAITLLAPQ